MWRPPVPHFPKIPKIWGYLQHVPLLRPPVPASPRPGVLVEHWFLQKTSAICFAEFVFLTPIKCAYLVNLSTITKILSFPHILGTFNTLSKTYQLLFLTLFCRKSDFQTATNYPKDPPWDFPMFHQDGGTGGRGCGETHKGDVTRVPPNFRDFLGNGGRRDVTYII